MFCGYAFDTNRPTLALVANIATLFMVILYFFLLSIRNMVLNPLIKLLIVVILLLGIRSLSTLSQELVEDLGCKKNPYIWTNKCIGSTNVKVCLDRYLSTHFAKPYTHT